MATHDAMSLRGHPILLPPNRVWRTYPGGATLDRLAGVSEPRDSHFAEDWIASVTVARNPGREHLREGVSTVLAGGAMFDLKRAIEADPDYFLGPAHLARHGPRPMLLVKYLDSAIRLHFQAHPTREFARLHLGSPSGKTEAYHILGVREGVRDPYVYMGFQHPPTRGQLRRMIEEQDVAAMERCFEKVPVAPGDTLLIPGGFPHALGGGVFMIEIQEPTDFVIRYEYERGGYVVPEQARFMGRDLDFALEVIDSAEHPVAEIDARWRCRPRRRRDLAPASWQEELIGPEQTPCFRVRRLVLNDEVVEQEPEFQIAIVAKGACTVSASAGACALRTHGKFLMPAGLGPVRISPEPGTEIIQCLPPL